MFTPERRSPAQKAAWRGSVDADIEMLFDTVTAHSARLKDPEEIVDADADIAQEDMDFLFDLIEDLSDRLAAVETRTDFQLGPLKLPGGGQGGSIQPDDQYWRPYVWPHKSPYWWNPIVWNTTSGRTSGKVSTDVGTTNIISSDD